MAKVKSKMGRPVIKNKEKLNSYQVYINDNLLEKVNEACKMTGLPKTQITRMALQAWVNKIPSALVKE